MKIIFLGSEVPSNRKLLIEQGVTHFGFSFLRAKKRGFPKTKRFSFWDYYPDNSKIVVHPGISEIKGSVQEVLDLAADYQDFIVQNVEDVAGFVEFDYPELGEEFLSNQRNFFAEADNFWPVWNPERGPKDLFMLAEEYENVAVPSIGAYNTPTHQMLGQMRGLSAQHGTSFHGLAVASPENISQAPLATASTLSWASPMMRGETIVWDGTRLVRYPKNMKEQARKRYAKVYDTAGLAYDKVLEDDLKEVTRLAIWSFLQLEKDMDKKKPANNPFTVIDGGSDAEDDVDNTVYTGMNVAGMIFGDVDNTDVEVSKKKTREPAVREPQERRMLPTFNVSTKTVVEKDDDGRDVLRDVPVLSSSGQSLRQCDTCFVASNCPAYKPESECAFHLPVEIKTKDQLVALLNAIIEMQGSRVAFAKFTEDLNGGYPDPNVSQEIDRLFKLVEQMKKLEDNREFVRMTFERQGGAGVLSSIFGDRAQVLREIDGGGMSEQQTNMVIKQSLEDDK